jgi:hypothetical protein
LQFGKQINKSPNIGVLDGILEAATRNKRSNYSLFNIFPVGGVDEKTAMKQRPVLDQVPSGRARLRPLIGTINPLSLNFSTGNLRLLAIDEKNTEHKTAEDKRIENSVVEPEGKERNADH